MTKLSYNNHIGYLTFNNPPDNKLIRPDFIDISIIEKFITENEVKALIISGSGRHFSVGADIKILLEKVKADTLEADLNKGKELLNYIYKLNIPVICAIEGVCFGGGLEIALSAHIRVASEKAILAFPETMHKLMPGLSGTYLLKKYLTLGNSIEMLLKGHTINAHEALEKGLVDYICPPKTALEFADKLAESLISSHPIKVINSVMQALKNAYELSLEDALKEESKLFCSLAKDVTNTNNEL